MSLLSSFKEDGWLGKVRPRLRIADAKTYYISWGYAIVNIVLGLGMFFLYETRIPLVVVNVLSYKQWGVLFLILGMLKAYSLLSNRWNMIKQLMILGLILKIFWGIALVIRCIIAPQTILITGVWLIFLYVESVIYIYFLPPYIDIKGNQK
jgi:hypothetical protein